MSNNIRLGWIERSGWLLAAFLVAILLTCLHLTMTEPFKLNGFSKLVNFEAAEPFQHRILLPAIAAGLQQLLPLGEKALFGLMEIIGWMALITLAYRALVIFKVGHSEVMRRVLAFTIVIPMFMHLIVPDLHLVESFVADDSIFDLGTWKTRPIMYYVYDLPAAAFTLAMVLLLARQHENPANRGFVLYLALFALATVNRETTVFMLPFFALLFWSVLTFRRWFVLLALQVIVFVAIQAPLHWLFQDNVNPNGQLAGSHYEYHLMLNLGLFTEPLYLLTFIARFAAGLYIPILLWRRYLDRRLGAALIGFGLPLLASVFVAGLVIEHRVFIELIPLIWVGAMQVIAARSAAADPRTEPTPSPTMRAT